MLSTFEITLLKDCPADAIMAATTSTPGGVSSQTVSPPAGDGFRRPSIDTSVPALNAQPVELDSTPIESPTTQRNTANAKDPAKGGIVSSPDEVQLGYENVSGIKGANAQEREVSASLSRLC